MNLSGFFLIVIILITAGSCRSGIEKSDSANTIPIQALYEGQQCPDHMTGITPIRDPQALENWWQPIAKQQFPEKPMPSALAALDFNESDVYVISMGSQASAGYDIKLNENRASLQNGALAIPAEWIRPPPDSMVPQVMTHPCIVIAMPAGRHKTVAVRNRQGVTLLETRF